MKEDLDLIRVTDVEYIKDYTMDLEFSNGKRNGLISCLYSKVKCLSR